MNSAKTSPQRQSTKDKKQNNGSFQIGNLHNQKSFILYIVLCILYY